MKIVVISPHRDDAAFSVGLTIQQWLKEGHDINILGCFTRSVYAPYSDAASLHINDRMSYVTALRAREDEAWSKLCRGDDRSGNLRLVDLRLKDAPLRLRCSPEDVLGLSPSQTDKAHSVIQRGLRTAGGHALLLPLAVGAHVDHLTARESALPAASGHVPCAFYEDLPYAARTGGLEQLETAIVDASRLLGEPLTQSFVTPLAADQSYAVASKRRMALCYDSQIDDAVVGHIAAFCTRYRGRERLWGNVAWHRAFPGSHEATC